MWKIKIKTCFSKERKLINMIIILISRGGGWGDTLEIILVWGDNIWIKKKYSI